MEMNAEDSLNSYEEDQSAPLLSSGDYENDNAQDKKLPSPEESRGTNANVMRVDAEDSSQTYESGSATSTHT